MRIGELAARTGTCPVPEIWEYGLPAATCTWVSVPALITELRCAACPRPPARSRPNRSPLLTVRLGDALVRPHEGRGLAYRVEFDEGGGVTLMY